MAAHDYKCNNEDCDFIEEYYSGFSTPKDMEPPEVCPKCKEGKLEKQFSTDRQSFDVVGGYEYLYGKHAKTPENQMRKADFYSDRNNSPY